MYQLILTVKHLSDSKTMTTHSIKEYTEVLLRLVNWSLPGTDFSDDFGIKNIQCKIFVFKYFSCCLAVCWKISHDFNIKYKISKIPTFYYGSSMGSREL